MSGPIQPSISIACLVFSTLAKVSLLILHLARFSLPYLPSFFSGKDHDPASVALDQLCARFVRHGRRIAGDPSLFDLGCEASPLSIDFSLFFS